VPGSAQAVGLLKELVYTITEEPGIRYAVVRENGKTASFDAAILWDRPLSREDVFGYSVVGPIGADHAISSGGPALPTSGQSSYQSGGSIGTGVKLTFDLSGGGPTPSAFSVSMTEARDDFAQMGKYVLTVVIGSTKVPTTWVGGQVQIEDSTPVRATFDGRTPGIFVRQVILDDARPWRAYTDGGKIVVDVGGDPRLVSDRISVDGPIFDQKVGPTLTLFGAARVFEANVVWRLKDSSQKIIASGHTNASLGSGEVWGTYRTTITIPASVSSGRLTLEVYEASPKDGSEQGLVSIPVNR